MKMVILPQKKFEETGAVTDIVRRVHRRSARSAENIATVIQSDAEDSNVSIGRSYGTLWRILHLNLHLHPYKVQLIQQL